MGCHISGNTGHLHIAAGRSDEEIFNAFDAWMGYAGWRNCINGADASLDIESGRRWADHSGYVLYRDLWNNLCILLLSGVRMVGAANASMLACVEPVAATVISVVWLGVEFQLIDLIGFAFVLSTVFIISLNQMKEEKRHELKRKTA